MSAVRKQASDAAMSSHAWRFTGLLRLMPYSTASTADSPMPL
jgi:hypothetical protein